jgi:hypothetical protein
MFLAQQLDYQQIWSNLSISKVYTSYQYTPSRTSLLIGELLQYVPVRHPHVLRLFTNYSPVWTQYRQYRNLAASRIREQIELSGEDPLYRSPREVRARQSSRAIRLAVLKTWPNQNLAQAGSLLACDWPKCFWIFSLQPEYKLYHWLHISPFKTSISPWRASPITVCNNDYYHWSYTHGRSTPNIYLQSPLNYRSHFERKTTF